MGSLPAYNQFSRLRLGDFTEATLHRFDNWTYQDRTWTGEGIVGLPFTEFLSPAHRPGDVGAVCLNLESLPASVGESILDRLAIPVRHGASRDGIEGRFGAPVSVLRFVEDRETLVYRLGERDQYETDFTVHERDGLVHMTMIKAKLLKHRRS